MSPSETSAVDAILENMEAIDDSLALLNELMAEVISALRGIEASLDAK